jgi:hypothetical protein
LDPQLQLVEVLANVYAGEELVHSISLLELESWDFEGGSFEATGALDLTAGPYIVEVEVTDELRTVTSEPQSFVYRVPVPLVVTIESPVDDSTYFAPVSVSGTVNVDTAFAANLDVSAYLETLGNQTSETIDVPLSLEGRNFSAAITQPGNYRLTVLASDGRAEAQASAEFVYIEPEIEVAIDHSLPMDAQGIVETLGEFPFSATLEGNIALVPQIFVLEHRIDGVWEALATFDPLDVWQAQYQMANLAFNFRDADLPPGQYELRLRVELDNEISASSESFVVNFREAAEPSLSLASPTAGTYFRNVAVQGTVTWDPLLSTPQVTAVLERAAAPLSIPLTITAQGSFSGTIPVAQLAQGQNSLLVRVQDGLGGNDQQRVVFTYLLPQVSVAVTHRHPLTANGGAIDLVGSLQLTASVTADERIPARGFALEILTNNQWQEVAVLSTAQNPTSRTATLTFNFGTRPFGLYQARVRVDYLTEDFVYSNPLPVQYRAALLPSITVYSPNQGFNLGQSLTVAGLYSVDPAVGLQGVFANFYSVTDEDAEPLFGPIAVTATDGIFDGAVSHERLRDARAVEVFVRDALGNISASGRIPFSFASREDFFVRITQPALETFAINDTRLDVSAEFFVTEFLGYEIQVRLLNAAGAQLYVEDVTTSRTWSISQDGQLKGTFDFSNLEVELAEGTYMELAVNYPQADLTLIDSVTLLYAKPAPPGIQIIEPVPSTLYSFDVAVSGTVTLAEGLGQDRIGRVYASLDRAGDEGSTIVDADIPLDYSDGKFSGQLPEEMMRVSGEYILNVLVDDNRGQIWSAASVRFRYELPAELEILVRAPAQQAQISNPNMAVSGTVQFQTGYPVQEFNVSLFQNNQLVRDPVNLLPSLQTNGAFSTSINFDSTPRLSDGTYVLRLSARDSRQRTVQQDVPVTLARLKSPTLSLIANPKGDESRLGGPYTAGFTVDSRAVNPTLRGQINHQDGTTTQLTLALPNPVPASGSASFDVADSIVKVGQNQIVVTLDDGYNTVVTATAVINFARPVVTIVAPQNNAAISGGTVNVQFGVTYAGINTNPGRAPSAQVTLNGTLQPKTPSGTPTTGLFQYSFSSTELLVGSNTVGIQVGDYRNPAVAGTAQVSFNYSRPTLILNITEPAANSTRIYTGNVTFNYTSSSPLSSAIYTINDTEDANVSLTRLSSPYSYTIVGEDRLKAGQNTIVVQATDANGVTAQTSRTFTYAVPSITNLKLTNADGNTQTTLMGDVELTFSSNVQLAVGQVFVNNEPVRDLVLNDTLAPFEYKTTLPGSAFISGQNLVQVDCYDVNKVPVSASANADYLGTAQINGQFTFGVGIGYSLWDITLDEEIQGVLAGFPSSVNSSQLTLSALFVDGVRGEFTREPTPPFFNYRFHRKELARSLGINAQKTVLATAYLSGNGTTVAADAVFSLYRYPGGRAATSNDQRDVTHISIDGHGEMVAFSTGENNFDGTGGGNQMMVSGSGSNRYYFDENSGADVIFPSATSVANNRIGNVLSYWGLSIQNLNFARIAISGDLLITHGAGYPNPFSWQLITGFFNYESRPVTSIAIPGDGAIPTNANIPLYEWTRWRDRVIPGGDIESISGWKEDGLMSATCAPAAIQARLPGTTEIIWPGHIYQDSGVESFDVITGYSCRDELTISGRCVNYEVRFLCQQPIVK